MSKAQEINFEKEEQTKATGSSYLCLTEGTYNFFLIKRH